MALSSDLAAPFASVREQGFLFKTVALKRGVTALHRAWRAHTLPLVFEGPEGLGKKEMVSAWLRHQPQKSIKAARISAAELSQRDLCAALLEAFGQRPASGASTEGALADFLEDCLFSGRPGFVLISDLHLASGDLWPELERLTMPRMRGGIGLPLVVTTARAPRGTKPFQLPAMSLSEVERFTRSVLEAAGVDQFELEQGFCEALFEASGGRPGSLGPLIDEAFAEAKDALAETEEPAKEEVSKPSAPSPKDIEDALQVLAQAGDADPAPKKEARRPRSYPKIAVGSAATEKLAPANDPRSQVAPKIAKDLEAVATEIAGLQGHLIVVRDQAEALESRLDERKRRREEAAQAFLATLNGA
ncbi:MAG: hypothetical protein AAF830_04045 [Pseudomonadota bacterium]